MTHRPSSTRIPATPRRLHHRLVQAAVVAAAGLTTLPALLPGGLFAQTINDFDVQAVDRLTPGTELAFTLWGTPGAQAAMRIDGAQRSVLLLEGSPGVYHGVHTISQNDRIAPDARVSANLRVGQRVATALLDEPLQNGWVGSSAATGLPQIDRFTVTQGGDRRSGSVVDLHVQGSPGARVTVQLPGADTRRIRLVETRPGEYSARYTVQPADRLRADADAVARMRLGDRLVTARLERALDGLRLPVVGEASPPCVDCGTVLSIQRVEVDGDGSYVGTVAGGLLGAVLGSQVGGGDGRKAAGVAGAVGGALIGREIDKRNDRRDHYEVLLSMADGRQEMLTLEDAPQVKVGDRVRLVDGALQPLVF